MKMITLIAALMLGTAAHAGPFGLPDHEPNGYRDTGCDPAQQVAVEGTNYFNNPSCPKVGGGSDVAAIERPQALKDEEEPPVDPVDPEPEPCSAKICG